LVMVPETDQFSNSVHNPYLSSILTYRFNLYAGYGDFRRIATMAFILSGKIDLNIIVALHTLMP